MEIAVPSFLYDDDFDESYLVCTQQANDEHDFDGTHKLDDPVSYTTLKSWPPIVTGPNYWASLKSLMFTSSGPSSTPYLLFKILSVSVNVKELSWFKVTFE